MPQPVLVSIITPTYNRAHLLSTAIASVQAQTYPHWEMIIVDDGSTDATRQLIRTLAEPRIRYVYQANAGPCAARNRAMPMAQGQWLAYLDSDNELLPEYLATMLTQFEQHPQARYGIPKGRYTYELYRQGQLVDIVDGSGQFPDQVSLADIINRVIPFDMNGFMHQRGLIEEGIRFDPSLPSLEDWDFVMQMGERHPQDFLYVPAALYSYHQRYGADGRFAGAGLSYADFAHKFELIYQKHQHDQLMRGQAWYPALVEQWLTREVQFQAGLLPPAYLYHFPRQWPKRLHVPI